MFARKKYLVDIKSPKTNIVKIKDDKQMDQNISILFTSQQQS